LTQLLGREREVGDAAVLVSLDDVRLVTLTGAGRIGKTRFSLTITERFADDVAQGVIWVPLAAIDRTSQVVAAIAQAMGLREPGEGTYLEGLKLALRHAEVLLVLDNFEHMIDAHSDVADLLASRQSVKVLETSWALLALPVRAFSWYLRSHCLTHTNRCHLGR